MRSLHSARAEPAKGENLWLLWGLHFALDERCDSG